MDPKWTQILVILVFCQKITSGDGEDKIANEGERVEIACKPDSVGMVVWFRVLDTSGMEFIASFTNGIPKSPSENNFPPTFSHSKIRENILILKSFTKARDSGAYSCASLRSNQLVFGKTTRVFAAKVEVAVVEAPKATTTTAKPNPTAAPCVCNNNKQEETSFQMFCTPVILGPLAGGCGLLLLLLIITALYCNQIRTRRCPHHYKRKPRMMAPGKPKTNHSHV